MILKNKYKNILIWGIITTLIFFEIIFFRQHVKLYVAPYYTINHDGADILRKTYLSFEMFKTQMPLLSIIKFSILPQSFIFVFHSALAFLIMGANRLSALTINLGYFLILQIYGFYVIKTLTKSSCYGLIFIGLILSVGAPYFWAGGINDFRIDFIAFNLYGLLVGSILISNVFEDKKWTYISCFFAIYCFCMRFITVFYIFGMIGLTLLSFVIDLIFCAYFFKKNILVCYSNYPDNKRIRNLIRFCIIFSIAFVIVCILTKDQLLNYYFVGHYAGEEKFLRLKESGVLNFSDYLYFYPQSLVKDHLGFFIFKLIGSFYFIVAIQIIGSFFQRKSILLKNNGQEFRVVYFLLYSILSPLLILTMDISKSPVVASIMVVPFIYLSVYGLWVLSALVPCKYQIKKYSEYIFVLAALGFGVFHFYQNNVGQISFIRHSTDLYQLYDDLLEYAKMKNKNFLYYGTDGINDFLGCSTIFNYSYEIKKLSIDFAEREALGGSIHAFSKDQILNQLDRVDFMILSDNKKQNFKFPSERALIQNLSVIKNHIHHKFIYTRQYNIFNQTFRLYLKK